MGTENCDAVLIQALKVGTVSGRQLEAIAPLNTR
jgi:hypothetical protein